MAVTTCPACGRPAELVDSRGAGRRVRVHDEAGLDLGERLVTERHIACADRETCGGLIHVVYRCDVYQGTTTKRKVGRNYALVRLNG